MNDLNGIPQSKLAFFQTLELKLVRVVGLDQVMNHIVEVTVLKAQFLQLVLQGLDFFFGKRVVDVGDSLSAG